MKSGVRHRPTDDSYCEIEMINAMIERKYIDQEEITCTPRQVGEALVTERKGKKLIGLVVKNHIDQQTIRPDIKKCIKEAESNGNQRRSESYIVW